MLKSRTTPTAMRGGISASHPDADNALGQAITALRRGEPVLICDNEISVLAVAAELATEENLRWLREISAGPMSVVLTRHRAVALGMSCALSISVSSQLPAAVIRNLADPAASLGAEPAGLSPEPVVAEGGVLAAAALAKLASCLPAALVLRVGAADAPLLAQCRDLASIEAAAVFKYDAAAGGLERVAEARVPLADAENARMIAFRPRDGGAEHLAILIGAPDPAAPVLVRLHSECSTGEPAQRSPRPATRRDRCDRCDRTGGRRGAALPRPGGTRHWSPQAAGLPVAGRRFRHARRQRAAGL